MTKNKITQDAEEINLNNATIEAQEIPYFQVPNSAVDEEGNMTAYELLVYFVLCRYGNRGRAAFPSYNTIARKAAISSRSVARALTGLLDKGYIVKQTRSGSSNVYRVLQIPMPEGHRGMPEGHRLPMSEGHTRKKHSFKNKKEEGTLTISLQEVIEHFKTLNPNQPVTKGNIDTLITLLNQYDIETIKAALTVHVNEPDEWTKQRGSSLSTFGHNLPNYILKVRERQEERRREELLREQQQQRDAEYRQEDEARRKEEARRAALTDEERRLEDIARRRDTLTQLITLREQMAADGCQESSRALKEYQEELKDLANEEAQLLPQVKEA